MKAYCIILRGNEYSERVGKRCIESAAKFGVEAERWDATPAEAAWSTMDGAGLKWTWAKNNTAPDVCPITGLKQHPYKTANFAARVGCALSHYFLWRRCAELGEPILILEHDSVFINPLPDNLPKFGATMINDPKGATPRGATWSSIIAGTSGVHDKTTIFSDGRPDGLAGGSAYVITPFAAKQCIEAYHTLGVWPNDATLCRQLIGGLHEVYPFVTQVKSERTLAEGY